MRRPEAAMKRILFIIFIWLACSQASFAAESDERFDKGVRLLNAGRFQEAAAAFQKVIDLDRDNVEAWFFLGQSCFGAGRCQEGLNAHEEAIHLQPAKAPYWVGKGSCLLCLGRTDEALSAFEKALELNKTSDYAWYGAARCYALKVDKEAALKHLSRAIELNSHYKNTAYRDGSFRNLSNDTDFQKLIEP
jgi:tetratricopeptide (TPR) repeat protein